MYGTLMRGCPAHRLMRNCRFYGKARARNLALYRVTDEFPGAVPEMGSFVLGEIYEVSQDTLRLLDKYEGSQFCRYLIEVETDVGDSYTAWTYLWAGSIENHERVPLEEQPWRPS